MYNKIDRMDLQPRVDYGEDGLPVAVWISAAAGRGLDLLLKAIAERLTCGVRRMRLRLPLSAGRDGARSQASRAARRSSIRGAAPASAARLDSQGSVSNQSSPRA